MSDLQLDAARNWLVIWPAFRVERAGPLRRLYPTDEPSAFGPIDRLATWFVDPAQVVEVLDATKGRDPHRFTPDSQTYPFSLVRVQGGQLRRVLGDPMHVAALLELDP